MLDGEGSPIWLWPNLLGIDAAIIAILWSILATRVVKVELNWTETAALFLVVWATYLGDRILDVLRPAPTGGEPARKQFTRRHLRPLFLILVTCLMGLVCVSGLLPREIIISGVYIATFVAIYFVLVHTALAKDSAGWPRELVVATIFAAGTMVPAIDGLRNAQTLALYWILQTALCCINLSAIEVWEWNRHRDKRQPSEVARWIAHHMGLALMGVALLMALAWYEACLPSSFVMAMMLACCGLAAVNRFRNLMSPDLLRVTADLALCAPLPMLLWHGPR